MKVLTLTAYELHRNNKYRNIISLLKSHNVHEQKKTIFRADSYSILIPIIISIIIPISIIEMTTSSDIIIEKEGKEEVEVEEQ